MYLDMIMGIISLQVYHYGAWSELHTWGLLSESTANRVECIPIETYDNM